MISTLFIIISFLTFKTENHDSVVVNSGSLFYKISRYLVQTCKFLLRSPIEIFELSLTNGAEFVFANVLQFGFV